MRRNFPSLKLGNPKMRNHSQKMIPNLLKMLRQLLADYSCRYCNIRAKNVLLETHWRQTKSIWMNLRGNRKVRNPMPINDASADVCRWTLIESTGEKKRKTNPRHKDKLEQSHRSQHESHTQH